MEKEPRKNPGGDTPAGYGGYTTRLQYEKARKKPPIRKLVILAVLCCLVIASVLGIAFFVDSLFFPDEKSEEGGGDTVRVPTGVELSQNAKDPEKMIRDLESSLVTVIAEKADGTVSYSSGFVISDGGYIIASNRILEAGGALRVYVGGISYNATFVGERAELGFALLRVESLYGLYSVSVGNFSFVSRGETLFAVGSTYGSEFCGTALSGMVASIGERFRVGEGESAILVPVAYLDVAPNQSVYGAPVVTAAGNVVGFCTDAISSSYGNLLTVIPIHTVYTIVNQMLGN